MENNVYSIKNEYDEILTFLLELQAEERMQFFLLLFYMKMRFCLHKKLLQPFQLYCPFFCSLELQAEERMHSEQLLAELKEQESKIRQRERILEEQEKRRSPNNIMDNMIFFIAFFQLYKSNFFIKRNSMFLCSNKNFFCTHDKSFIYKHSYYKIPIPLSSEFLFYIDFLL